MSDPKSPLDRREVLQIIAEGDKLRPSLADLTPLEGEQSEAEVEPAETTSDHGEPTASNTEPHMDD
jgi:hypothetical protein